MDELRDEIAPTLLQKFSQMHRSFLSAFHLLILVLFTMSMSLWGDAYYEDISLVKGERERGKFTIKGDDGEERRNI